MKLFKDVYCKHCGKKTGALLRVKLNDENYLCSECYNLFPAYMMETVTNEYSYQDFLDFLEYSKYSQEVLKTKFVETHKYYNLHLDCENGIFYIKNSMFNEPLYLECKYVGGDFLIDYIADTYKDGIIGGKVNGKVICRIPVKYPYFNYEEVLDKNAKAKAKKTFFGSEVKYDRPKGLVEFFEVFVNSILKHADLVVDESDEDLKQAVALYMIDDINEVTIEELKKQRNRLIQIYHPDKNDEIDDKYIKKINHAYDLIEQFIKREL